MAAGETLRTFLALEIPGEVRDALRRIAGELRGRGVEGKWVRPESIHLTLKFLGSTPVEKVDAIRAAVGPVVQAAAPFTLTAEGLGVFRTPRNPRVLWVGLTGDVDACVRLAGAIDAALVPLGFEPEQRAFHPHLTLARFKTRPQRRALETALAAYEGHALGGLSATELVHYRSHLAPTGATYEVLSRFELAGKSS